ncbi:lipid-A-disaccharide synthase [Thiohalobacter sp.]|uniref:lipid-A-disaccharide synthase n=1 Tax=Thiohalobacter sp. TaxID=2025948 RepID=UPI0026301444|nr:lipid-A-disaccharide synthase [Thiohalobacter sp.]
MVSERQGRLRLGLVAGEMSGDLLGGALLEALAERCGSLEVSGICGPRMQAAGCRSLYPLASLSVMGLVEVLRHLPGLLRLRRQLARRLLAERPAVFVGVDAPDFNLGLERRLRAGGIPTVHFVSPSVWAWRRYRVRRIARSVDLMLTLFPFEADFYREAGVPVRFVGHPLADEIPDRVDASAARAALGLGEGPLIALLPGSRRGEVGRLADVFLGAARWCLEQRPSLRFVAPMASAEVRADFEAALSRQDGRLPVTLLDGRAREAMAAADAVLLASGTATLEAMLLKRPMVVAYRVAPLTHRLLRRLVAVDRFALPNLLAGETLVPEFIQDRAQPEALGSALLGWLDNATARKALVARFDALHHQLRRDAARQAAEAVLSVARP